MRDSHSCEKGEKRKLHLLQTNQRLWSGRYLFPADHLCSLFFFCCCSLSDVSLPRCLLPRRLCLSFTLFIILAIKITVLLLFFHAVSAPFSSHFPLFLSEESSLLTCLHHDHQTRVLEYLAYKHTELSSRSLLIHSIKILRFMILLSCCLALC